MPLFPKLLRSAAASPPEGDPPLRVAGRQGPRSHRLLILAIRLIFMVLMVAVTLLTLASRSEPGEFDRSTLVGLLMSAAALALVIVLIDAITPNKRLASVVAVYLGICFGLIGALAIGVLIDTVARAWELQKGPVGIYIELSKGLIGIVLCYLSVSVVLSTKDDLRLVIPYVEFSRKTRGIRPLLVDTSVLVDGRVDELGRTGFLEAPMIVPQFVLDELQALADSGDRLRRSRGRRGLETMSRLQANPHLDVSIEDRAVEGLSVDHKLIELARLEEYRILTSDSNLGKVAEIKGVPSLNLNDLAGVLRGGLATGDRISIEIVKAGENPGQGVGYLADGTMVVVESASERIGESVAATVTNAVQTAAGRLIFARLAEDAEAPATPRGDEAIVRDMARAATEQPRSTARPDRPPRRGGPTPGRNPRG